MDYLKDGGDIHKYDGIKSQKIYGTHIQNPEFTIMIPTYKRLAYLKSSLKSAVSQEKISNYEIVIVDNDSEREFAKEILAVIKQYRNSNIIYYINEKNIGIYGNTLRAAQLARGKYIVLLNDDDLLHPKYLYVIYKFIKKYNYYGILGSMPYEFSKDDFVFPSTNEPICAFKVTNREFFFGRSVTSPGLMYPRKILEEIYNAYEELLMGDQIIQYKGLKKYQMIYIDFPMAAYRISDNATRKESVLMEMIYHMCMFKSRIAQDDWILYLFMKIFKKDFYKWYIDNTLYFWKKRSISRRVCDLLDLENVDSWSIKRMFLNEFINKIHDFYHDKHRKCFDSIEVD